MKGNRNSAKPKSWVDLSCFNDIHKGRKCYVIGAGPSIAFLDLQKIHKHVVVSINSSALLMPWDKDGDELRRFWISNDVLCMQWTYFWTHVYRAKCTKIVRTSWKKNDETLRRHNFRYFMPRKSQNAPLDPEDPGLCSVSSVPTGIDFALRLGCRNIYLLGVDQRMMHGNSHFWQFWPKEKHPQRESKGKNFQPEQKHQIKVFDQNVKVFGALDLCAKSKGAEIKNCNLGSVLDAFPKISFDESLKEP